MEDNLKLQSRANERFQDQIVEEIKEIETKEVRRSSAMVQKKHVLWRSQNGQEDCRVLETREE